jgi:hypothetical protein
MRCGVTAFRIVSSSYLDRRTCSRRLPTSWRCSFCIIAARCRALFASSRIRESSPRSCWRVSTGDSRMGSSGAGLRGELVGGWSSRGVPRTTVAASSASPSSPGGASPSWPGGGGSARFLAPPILTTVLRRLTFFFMFILTVSALSALSACTFSGASTPAAVVRCAWACVRCHFYFFIFIFLFFEKIIFFCYFFFMW